MNYPKGYPYYQETYTYYHIFFDQLFYVGELILDLHHNYDKELVWRQNKLHLYIEPDIRPLFEKIKQARRVDTNVLSGSALFRVLKQQLPRLKATQIKSPLFAYHDLAGTIINKEVSRSKFFDDLYRRKTAQIEEKEGGHYKVPPEILAVAGLCGYCQLDINNVDYSTVSAKLGSYLNSL